MYGGNRQEFGYERSLSRRFLTNKIKINKDPSELFFAEAVCWAAPASMDSLRFFPSIRIFHHHFPDCRLCFLSDIATQLTYSCIFFPLSSSESSLLRARSLIISISRSPHCADRVSPRDCWRRGWLYLLAQPRGMWMALPAGQALVSHGAMLGPVSRP